MRELRNPFKLRASEHIENDTTFLKLFGPEVLAVLSEEQPWKNVSIIRSAEGGGKTSLLRLFSPSTLRSLYSLRAGDDCKELYHRLNKIGAISENGPEILGITLSCARNYAALEDMNLEQGRSKRLLLGLINARIILASLRESMVLKNLQYPSDLNRLDINMSSASNLPIELSLISNGKDLYEWATEREVRVCEAIDSFGPLNVEKLTGNEELYSLKLIASGVITLDNQPIAKNILLMLDDVQKLTHSQRRYLIDNIIEARSPVGVWIAERFEALSTDEMLSSGAKLGRDYQAEILLENYWIRHFKKFEKFVLDVADRRASNATDVEVKTFGSNLQSSLESEQWNDKHIEALHVIKERIKKTVEEHSKRNINSENLFRDWIEEREKFAGTVREKALAWRGLEILIEREKRKNQRSLYDEPIPVKTLKEKDDSPIRAAAELFVAKEFNLPYYFGQSILSKLASANIEQFIWLAGELFEQITAASLLKKSTDVLPEKQEILIKQAADVLWGEIPKRVKHGREIQSFLESIGNFSEWMTYKPTSPNDIGVNGIAILMDERELLIEERESKFAKDYKLLGEVIASAIAHNLLEPLLDYNVKNKKMMVLNLNRLLCVRFNLPLHYGKFKEKPLDTLNSWLHDGYKIPKREEPLYGNNR